MFNYCVYFTTYSGQLMPPFYIGSKSVKAVKNGYQGSVNSQEWKDIWKKEIKNHPELFHTEIVSLHKTRKQAYNAEREYQIQENVVESEFYINKTIANSRIGLLGNKSKLGQTILQETKDKISKANTGINRGRTKNIGRIPWNKNKKYHMKTFKGSIKVQCIETGQIFNSIREACRSLIPEANDANAISRCARGLAKTAYGYTWRFIDN